MDIDKVAELNIQVNKDKKDLDKYKVEIKKELGNKEGVIVGKHYSAIVTNKHSESLNVEKALEVAKKLDAHWLIKTVEVIDEQALEDSIATGEIEGKEFADCIESKNTLVLTFKENK